MACDAEKFSEDAHQVAHVYVRDRGRIGDVKALLERLPGVDMVLTGSDIAAAGLDHERSGELIAVSAADAWFTYYYWLNDARAPDYARTVDIHRKPGYDPAELFVDPSIPLPKVKVGYTLAKKKLGFRYLMEMIPLDASIVRGSHGRITDRPEDGPVFMSSEKNAANGVVDGVGDGVGDGRVPCTAIRDAMLAHLFDQVPGTTR